MLYYNEGDGSFTDVTAKNGTGDPGFSASAAFFDYDGDGRLDLFVANYVDFKLSANRYCTRLGGQRDYCGPVSYEAAPDRLHHNEGDGTFADVTVRSGISKQYGNGLGVACADFDGDDWPDIFVANDATPNQLWINHRDGTFENRALAAGCALSGDGLSLAGMGIAAGDFDRDGDLDVYITHEISEPNTLYRNLGNGQFEDASAATGLFTPSFPYSGFGTFFFDYDNDGWLDLFVANGSVRKLASQTGDARPFRQPDQLFHNTGGRFVEVTQEAGLESASIEAGRGAAFGDIDNDGDLDVLVSNNAGPLRLLRKNVGSKNHWLRVSLNPMKPSNSALQDKVQAKVKLKLAGGLELQSTMAAGGSYCSSSESTVHFGLNGTRMVDGLSMEAAGAKITLPGPIQADRCITIPLTQLLEHR